jgi:hypothetical protein
MVVRELAPGILARLPVGHRDPTAAMVNSETLAAEGFKYVVANSRGAAENIEHVRRVFAKARP